MRRFGVEEANILEVVLAAFCQVAIEWPTFVAAQELPRRTARRRWIAGVLLRAVFWPGDAAKQSRTPSRGLQLLRRATNAERWRAWTAHQVDGLTIAEIARLEGRTPARICRLLNLAHRDISIALSQLETRSR